MKWAKLNSAQLKLAQYNPDRKTLYVKFLSGKTVTHTGIMPHVYENLVTTPDPDFYYSYYVAPDARRVTQTGVVLRRLIAFATLSGILWLSFSGSVAILKGAPPFEASMLNRLQ